MLRKTCPECGGMMTPMFRKSSTSRNGKKFYPINAACLRFYICEGCKNKK